MGNLVTVCSWHQRSYTSSVGRRARGWSRRLVKPLGRGSEPRPAPSDRVPETAVFDPHRVAQAAGYSRIFDMVKLL